MSEIRTDTINNASGDNDSGIDLSTNDQVSIKTANTTAVTVDASGNLMVATTNNNPASGNVVGSALKFNGQFNNTVNGGIVANFNRKTDDGEIVKFRKDGVVVGSIGSASGAYLYFTNGDTGLKFVSADDSIRPANGGSDRDNAIDLGTSGARFDDIYATNGTIQTSDRNEKRDIEELSEAEQRVAVVAKGLMRKFRWIDSVAEKGDNARTHFGIIAQDLQDAFTAEGLDASDYAMFTSNTWWEKEISVDAVVADEANGIEAKDAYTYIDTKDETTEGYTEKTRLGVRYSELLAFIISAL